MEIRSSSTKRIQSSSIDLIGRYIEKLKLASLQLRLFLLDSYRDRWNTLSFFLKSNLSLAVPSLGTQVLGCARIDDRYCSKCLFQSVNAQGSRRTLFF